jgi:hypothetical protein
MIHIPVSKDSLLLLIGEYKILFQVQVVVAAIERRDIIMDG